MDDGNGSGTASTALYHLLDRGDAWLHSNAANLFGDIPILGRLLMASHMTARSLLLALMALLGVCVAPPLTEWLLRRFHWIAANFRGEQIPQSYGLAILFCASGTLWLDAWTAPETSEERLLWLGCIAIFCALGFLDDLLGDRTIKGLRGHFRALLRDRRVTTGLIKAAGGLTAGLWIGYSLHGAQPLLVLLSATVIALSANAMNLLDVRPGRAGGAFCVAALVLSIVSWRGERASCLPELLYVAIPALVAWTHDADARVMLGDAGSNLLGAALGLAVCVTFGIAAQLMVLLGLAALHVAAERVSITRVIENSPLLSAIDRLSGVRSLDSEDRRTD